MTARQSAATERALARVAQGATAYSAAKSEGIALSTIYRALRRARAAEQAQYEAADFAHDCAREDRIFGRQ